MLSLRKYQKLKDIMFLLSVINLLENVYNKN